MKQFLIFILFLTILIVAEYGFFTEVFGQRRLPFLLLALLAMSMAAAGIFRLAKKLITR